ncbi:MAG TPA: pyridoxamine 5'-phosphate oxidase [Paenalcaligenes sp.]|nr:pyridoxamine 5'-phosphate oxidase [Paenalcaligenes sp.]
MSLADYRNEYGKYQLPDKDLLSDPKEQFHKWLKQAMDNDAPEPTAMTLSTVNKDGQPTARIVLLKGYDDNGLCFYTNYESRKGQELVHNNKACLSFFWPTMQRQVRFEGPVIRIPHSDSEAYFRSRPLSSKINAWASPQSQPISVDDLRKRSEHYAQVLGSDPECPPFWGGYYLQPDYIEFWQGRTDRLHDRYAFSNNAQGSWDITRLGP